MNTPSTTSVGSKSPKGSSISRAIKSFGGFASLPSSAAKLFLRRKRTGQTSTHRFPTIASDHFQFQIAPFLNFCQGCESERTLRRSDMTPQIRHDSANLTCDTVTWTLCMGEKRDCEDMDRASDRTLVGNVSDPRISLVWSRPNIPQVQHGQGCGGGRCSNTRFSSILIDFPQIFSPY